MTIRSISSIRRANGLRLLPAIALTVLTALLAPRFAALGTLAHAAGEVDTPVTIWGTVGSTGTFDESSRPKVGFEGPNALVKWSGSVTLRYNVVPSHDVADVATGVTMALRYRDNGNRARVRAKLVEVNVIDGHERVLAHFDSNDHDDAYGMRLREVDVCDYQFDVFTNVYYIEARLDRQNAHGYPRLMAIQLTRLECAE